MQKNKKNIKKEGQNHVKLPTKNGVTCTRKIAYKQTIHPLLQLLQPLH